MANSSKHYRVTVPVKSGLPDDSPTFDFTFSGPAGAPIVDANVVALLTAFFDTGNVHNKLSGYLGTEVDRTTNWDIAGTDITGHEDGSPAGPPNFRGSFPVTGVAISDVNLPREVSYCIPVHALDTNITEFGPGGQVIPSDDRAIDEGAPATHLGRTRPKSRYRGRIFYGPLNAGTLDKATTTDEPIVSSLMLADVGTAAARMVANGPGEGALWGVWSRRDAVVRTIVGGWVTEEFASSRRRRLEPLSKVTWP